MQWLQDMDQNLWLARQSIKYPEQRMKEHADVHRRELEFAVGDRVLLHELKQKTPLLNITGCEGATKLNARYVGACPIIERVSELAYRLETPAHNGNKVLTMERTLHVCTMHLRGNSKILPSISGNREDSGSTVTVPLDGLLDSREFRALTQQQPARRGCGGKAVKKWH